jgi:hypothetical protein
MRRTSLEHPILSPTGQSEPQHHQPHLVRPWLKPHLLKGFKISKGKRFAEKLEDIVGPYLNPPEHAIVMCVDEKSQIQALDRIQPGLAAEEGPLRNDDSKRQAQWDSHAVCAPNVADGTVISMCDDRQRHQKRLHFLRVVDQVTPAGRALHSIADNYATHKHVKVQRWLKPHDAQSLRVATLRPTAPFFDRLSAAHFAGHPSRRVSRRTGQCCRSAGRTSFSHFISRHRTGGSSSTKKSSPGAEAPTEIWAIRRAA